MIEIRSAAPHAFCHMVDDELLVRAGTMGDIPAIKAIADREKHALGFVHRGSLTRAVARDELIVASFGVSVVGFCQFYRRRDGAVTIYHVAVVPERRGEGIGRAMLASMGGLQDERGPTVIRVKCPAELSANAFYARIGFRLATVEAGRRRPLNVWERCAVQHPRPPPQATPP